MIDKSEKIPEASNSRKILIFKLYLPMKSNLGSVMMKSNVPLSKLTLKFHSKAVSVCDVYECLPWLGNASVKSLTPRNKRGSVLQMKRGNV